MIVIAHRGANREALENSYSAFDLALESGAQRIEIDLQIAADGGIFINHDDSLLRTTGMSQKISQLSSGEIRHLKLRNGEPIPSLEDVLERYLGRLELNLEIKGNRPEIAHIAAKQVMQTQKQDQIIFSCFDPLPLEVLRDHYGELRRACLWGGHYLPSIYWGLLAPQNFMQHIRTRIFHPLVDLLNDNLIDQAKQRDWIIYPWATMHGKEDKEREVLWQKLLDWKVDGFCTNYPREMNLWLAGKHLQA
jgi:glycerophosphoryl diester phosphodiesterase